MHTLHIYKFIYLCFYKLNSRRNYHIYLLLVYLQYIVSYIFIISISTVYCFTYIFIISMSTVYCFTYICN